MVKIQKSLAIAMLIVFAAASGCARAKSPAEKVAQGFMDAYYVDADLHKASEFSDGLALEKVRGGMKLRDGLSVDAAAHHPKIHCKLERSQMMSDQAEFFYDVEFHPEKAQVFHKKTRLRLRLREGGQWKVTQFSDYDSL